MKNRAWVVLALLMVISAPSFGLQPTRVRHRKLARLRHYGLLMARMFIPSAASLLKQNELINLFDLPRIADNDELEALKASEELVPLRVGPGLRIQPALDLDRRYCRPWTRDFVEDLSLAYYTRFHDQLQINSAVRTVLVQHKLRRHNRNAAPERGEYASSHLAGTTLDLQRRGMTRDQMHFVERYLFYLKALGLVEPEEERRQWVFHIMVSKNYADWRKSQTAMDLAPFEDSQQATDVQPARLGP